MVIEAQASEHFVQLQKYRLRNGEIGLELWFPEVAWSTAYVQKLRDALTVSGTPFRETYETHDRVKAFIHVDCGDHIPEAVNLVHRCFFYVFGLASDIRFTSKPADFCTRVGEVADTDTMKLSTLEFHNNGRAFEREEERWENANSFFAGLFVLCMFLCYPALWLSLYLNHEAPAEWHLDLSFLSVEGSYSTAILLLIFGALLSATIWLASKLSSKNDETKSSWLDLAAFCLAAFGLPIAVLLSWFGL